MGVCRRTERHHYHCHLTTYCLLDFVFAEAVYRNLQAQQFWLILFHNARSWNIFIWPYTSLTSSDNFSSCVWIPLLSVGKTFRLLFIGGSVISISCSSSPSILNRSRCSSTNLFGTVNTLRDPIFQKAVPHEKVITMKRTTMAQTTAR